MLRIVPHTIPVSAAHTSIHWMGSNSTSSAYGDVRVHIPLHSCTCSIVFPVCTALNLKRLGAVLASSSSPSAGPLSPTNFRCEHWSIRNTSPPRPANPAHPLLQVHRCRANLGKIMQARPDSGLGLFHFQCEGLQTHLRYSLPARSEKRWYWTCGSSLPA